SGGPDSVALAHILRALTEAGTLQLVALAHLNHQLRTSTAADEAFCRELAARLGVAFEAASVDVRRSASEERCSIEAAGHRLRHEFLTRAAAAQGADVVALCLTRDDQAETVLLRLLRG